jgi:hypothetical protein
VYARVRVRVCASVYVRVCARVCVILFDICEDIKFTYLRRESFFLREEREGDCCEFVRVCVRAVRVCARVKIIVLPKGRAWS